MLQTININIEQLIFHNRSLLQTVTYVLSHATSTGLQLLRATWPTTERIPWPNKKCYRPTSGLKFTIRRPLP